MEVFKKALMKTKKAAGGLMIIIISILGATTLNYTTRLSSEDLTRSICDQAAHFVTFRAASYLSNVNAPSGKYTYIRDSNGNYMNFAKEYSDFLKNGFEGKSGTTEVFEIHWDKDSQTASMIKVDPVETMLNGEPVKAQLQYVVIE